MESEVRVPAQPPPPLPGDGEKGRAEAPLPLELGDISSRTVLATGFLSTVDRRWEGDASAPGHLDVTSALAHNENFSASRCRLENELAERARVIPGRCPACAHRMREGVLARRQIWM